MTSVMEDIDSRMKLPQVRWDRAKRLVVCLLFRYYKTNKVAFEAIFNTIFKDDLLQCGFKSGIWFDRMNTQNTSLRLSRNETWLEVNMTMPFEKYGPWSDTIRLIENTATELGLALLDKETNDTVTSRFYSRGLGDLPLVR